MVFKTVANAPVTLPISSITSNGSGNTGNSNGSGATSGSGMSPAGAAEARASVVGCQILNLNLGPLSLNLLGLVVNLNQVILNITAVPGAGALLGNLLCGVANLLNGGLGLGSLANLLNSILQILRPTSVNSPFANIPLLGTVGAVSNTTGATNTVGTGMGAGAIAPRLSRDGAAKAGTADNFVGLFTIKRFVKNTAGDGLLAQGTVTGLFGNGKNGTQDISIPVTPTAGPAGPPSSPGTIAAAGVSAERAAAVSCQILNLDLAPTNLNLLGLVVNLNRVVLNITAVPGAGALLGNLLCGVANLLDLGGLLGLLTLFG